MKSITVSVDDETYRRSRIRAAEAGTSVTALVRSYLVSITRSDSEQIDIERLKRLQDETLASIRARGARLSSAGNLTRDALHDRRALR